MPTRPPKMSRRRKLIAFAPALVLVGLTAMIASGVSIIPGATAANTVAVGGTVNAGMSVSPDTNTAQCGNGNLSVGTFGTGFSASTATCTVSYNTNNATGATLSIRDNDATAPTFCTGACTASSLNSLESPLTAATPGPLGDDEFGAALVSTAGSPAPAAGAEYVIDASPGAQGGGESIWGPVSDVDQSVCLTSAASTSDQSCEIRFGVDGGNGQQSGTYAATVRLNATANP